MKKQVSHQRTQLIMMFFAFAFGMILSNLLHTQSTQRSNQSLEEILFIYRGIEKTTSDLIESDRQKIQDLNQKKIKLIENSALRQYFADEAAHQGQDIESLVHKNLQWGEVTDSEINNFYLLNEREINRPLFEVRAEIKKKLELKQARHIREKLLDDLKNKGDLAILPR